MKRKGMGGVYVVEFAIIGSLLFLLLFGVLEFGRAYFTINAMNEVVRRGARLAAVCNIQDPVILYRAIFNGEEANNSDSSRIVAGLTPSDLKLQYFDDGGYPVPDPGGLGFTAIRFVRLTVEDFPFNLLIPGFDGAITLPRFQATLPRESLGRHAEGDKPEAIKYDAPLGITPC